jgi:hypothetical protein
VPDGLWQRIEPVLPPRQQRFRYPGHKPLDDRRVLEGILFVLHTGIGKKGLSYLLATAATSLSYDLVRCERPPSARRAEPDRLRRDRSRGWR